VPAADVDPEVARVLFENLLDPRLRNPQRVRVIGARPRKAERDRQPRERRMRHRPSLSNEPLSQPAPGKKVERTRIEIETPAELRPPPMPLDQRRSDTGEPQLTGE
jgi:hypothetical protein